MCELHIGAFCWSPPGCLRVSSQCSPLVQTYGSHLHRASSYIPRLRFHHPTHILFHAAFSHSLITTLPREGERHRATGSRPNPSCGKAAQNPPDALAKSSGWHAATRQPSPNPSFPEAFRNLAGRARRVVLGSPMYLSRVPTPWFTVQTASNLHGRPCGAHS